LSASILRLFSCTVLSRSASYGDIAFFSTAIAAVDWKPRSRRGWILVEAGGGGGEGLRLGMGGDWGVFKVGRGRKSTVGETHG
jgi:hypothetical protein